VKNTEQRPVRVGMVALGCAKNLVDAEIMLGSLMKEGMELTNDPAAADVLIVNTCSFIDAAQEESVDTILESDQLRAAQNRGQGLIVSGCLPQRFRDELPTLLPEVDAFMGIDQVANAPEIVRQALAHRVHRLAQLDAPKSRGKKKIVQKLEELNKSGAAHTHDDEESLRGTDKFGKTRTVITPPPPVTPLGTLAPIVEVNNRPTFIPDFETPRFRLTPAHFAYVKIAEGCNHPCSFCIIPRMRGGHRSRQLQDIVREVRELVNQGVKEINLISQDSTYYGLDLRPNRTGSIAAPDKFREAALSLPTDTPTLCSLLRELNAIPGDFWIRLLYTHPAHWTDELIKTIAECEKVPRYIDMPLQHIHGTMLERMRRETSQQYIVDLIAKIRAGIPNIAIRTTFIVGFPGETDEYFDTLLKFIKETKFERLGIFTYSQESGTRASSMASQVPDKVKQRRRELAMAAQREVAAEVAGRFVGKTIKVLVEKAATAAELNGANVSSWEHGFIRNDKVDANVLKGKYLVARGEADAPDIDGRVYIRGKLPLSEFANVKIIGHTDYDLIAEPVR
jgi:ribosomal protein S12 methylthiotransferase